MTAENIPIIIVSLAVIGSVFYLTSTVNKRIDEVSKRIDDLIYSVNKRIDDLQGYLYRSNNK